MDKDLKKAVKKSKVALQPENTSERGNFKKLLLKNPNYFGNLIESSFKPVKPICCNTYYEELGCVGFHPQQEYLQGVVYVYQQGGYGSGICGNGSTEYVRFYLSSDNGVSWQDQGVTSFKAYNIPQATSGSDRLEYAVSLKVDPANKFCFLNNHLIQVRAILSWNDVPPANQPDWKPVWGNVVERTIQTEPKRLFFPSELVAAAEGIKIPKALLNLVDDDQPLMMKTQKLEVVELAKLYADKGVSMKRYALKELTAHLNGTTQLPHDMLANLNTLFDKEFDVDSFTLEVEDGDGNVGYEELRCIGLDPNDPNVLVGVIQMKKSAGYSGGPCTDGSMEYVSFWGDTNNNGTFETHLGTASVRVYDLTNVPGDGVYYAVRLPVDLSAYRKPCTSGPVIIPIRAILSWNVAPPANNPDYVPVWGNREETLIQVPVTGMLPQAGKMAIIGGIPTSHISNLDGATLASAVFATNNLPPDSLGRPCPFAGRVSVQGAPVFGYSYSIEVVPVAGGIPVPVVKDLILTRDDGTTWVHSADPVTKRFNYVHFTDNVNSLMAQWDTTGDDRWIVRLKVYDPMGSLVGIDEQRIQLDNTWPEASLAITSGTGDCGKFAIGDVITGEFTARDQWLGRYSLAVEPAINPANTFLLSPSSGNVQTPVSGSSWSLDTNGVPDTTGMQSCGYVVRLSVVDRAIRNSQSVGHWVTQSVGFCLEEEV